jgi:hypothetical protein
VSADLRLGGLGFHVVFTIVLVVATAAIRVNYGLLRISGISPIAGWVGRILLPWGMESNAALLEYSTRDAKLAIFVSFSRSAFRLSPDEFPAHQSRFQLRKQPLGVPSVNRMQVFS